MNREGLKEKAIECQGYIDFSEFMVRNGIYDQTGLRAYLTKIGTLKQSNKQLEAKNKELDNKCSQFVDTVDSLLSQVDSLKCCGNCDMYSQNKCHFSDAKPVDIFGDEKCDAWVKE